MNPFEEFCEGFHYVADVRPNNMLVEDNPTPVRALVHPLGVIYYAEDVQDVDPSKGKYWTMIEKDDWQSDNWKVIAAINYAFAIWELGKPNPLVPAIKAEIQERGDLMECRSFTELHDKCDANCLGGLCEDGHWIQDIHTLSEVAFTDIVEHAQTVVDEWLARGLFDDEPED